MKGTVLCWLQLRHPAISNKSTVISTLSQFSIKSEILGASGSLSLYFTNRPGSLSLSQT